MDEDSGFTSTSVPESDYMETEQPMLVTGRNPPTTLACYPSSGPTLILAGGVRLSVPVPDDVEPDRAVVPALSQPQACTESSSDAPLKEAAVANMNGCQSNLRSFPGTKESYNLSLFDKQGMLSSYTTSNMNSMKSYDVREPMGCALLFSSYFTSAERKAVRADMEEISQSLEGIGFDILYKTDDVRRHGLLSNLRGLGEETIFNHSSNQWCRVRDYSVFLFYYTGHGQAKGITLYDGVVEYSEIVKTLSADAALRDKPKIFIFDSCRVQATGDYYSELQKIYCQESQDDEAYPPPHTMICFSSAEGQFSFMAEGSFYTRSLSHSLRQFGQHFTVAEIITQVHGGTASVVKTYNRCQRPIFLSNLEKLLVLRVNCNPHAGSHQENVQPSQESGPQGKCFVTGDFLTVKGFDVPKDYLEVVEKDHVPKDPQFIEWKSKEDVIKNRTRLGNGISVFILYAPNPDDPYEKVTKDNPAEQRNKFFICRLIFDLEQHGFHATSDLHLGGTEPSNWVQWYVTRISQCNFVLFVCSPAFKQLFEKNLDTSKLDNPKARRLAEYKNAVYSGMSADISKGGERRKFLPVILDVERYGERVSDCVPMLFQTGTVFHLDKDEKRLFNFDNDSRHFERLVCHMAGINRFELMKAEPMDMPKLPGLFDAVNVECDSQKPPPGYVVVGDPLPNHSVVGSSRPHQYYQPPSQYQPHPYAGHQQYTQPAYQPRPQTGYPQPAQSRSAYQPQPQSAYQPRPQSAYPPGFYQQSGYQSQNQPHLQPGFQLHPYPQPGIQPHPQALPQNQPPLRPHPHPTHQPHLQQAPSIIVDPRTLPLKVPDQRLYLWLAKKIVSWKFIARHLGLEEGDIQRIVVDHGNFGTDEQCVQMFLMWERYFTGREDRGCDYRTLGEVLRTSEKNRHLYPEYVEKVKALEKK